MMGSYGDGQGGLARGRIGMVRVRGDRIEGCNLAFASTLALTCDALIGRSLAALVEGPEAQLLVPLLAKFGTDRTTIPIRHARLCRPDGSAVTAEISLLAIEPGGASTRGTRRGREEREAIATLAFEFASGEAISNGTVGPAASDADRRYRLIYENVAEGIYLSALDGIQISANPALVRLNGYDSEAEMLCAVNDIAREWYVDPERRDEFRRLLRRDGVVRDFVSEIYRHKTRERIWISENARLVRDPTTGEPTHYEGTVREVTGTVTLLREKERHAKIAAQAPGWLFQSELGADGVPRFTFASEGVRALCGVAPDEIVRDPSAIGRRVHPDDREPLLRAIARSARALEPWEGEFRMRRTDGADIWVGGAATPEACGATVVWHGFMSDVTARRRADADMRRLAYADALTGLPNRAAFRLEAERVLASHDGQGGALLFVDLDNFKLLNDLHGHALGDRLLVGVAARLKAVAERFASQCRPECRMGERADGGGRCVVTVARLGGDEFVLLLSRARRDPALAALDLAEDVREALAAPFDLDGVVHATSPSIGIATFDGDAEGDPARRLDDLLQHADVAMYRAKSAGRNAVRAFEPSMQAEVEATVALHADVRRAIEEGTLELHVQPLVDARNAWPTGGEALLRWFHPERGAVAPDRLVTAAEQIGLSDTLEAWVLERACRILNEWRDLADALPVAGEMSLSVNIAPASLQHPDFVERTLAVLDRTGVAGNRLVLEVTEHGVLHDLEDAVSKMDTLRARGLRFALDDFGTGYASLSYLKRLPLDVVKIDRSFVRDMLEDAGDRAIVDATIAVAHRLGRKVTAEGVESLAQAVQLNASGCDTLQGYAFARALPPDELLSWLRQRTILDAPGESPGRGATALRA